MEAVNPSSENQSTAAQRHALRARAEKQAAALAIGVDADFVSRLVDGFYAKVQRDDVLAPIFAARVADWPVHLDRMKAFWRSILFNSGEFSGNPMRTHAAIPDLAVAHFARWLGLFYETLRSLEQHPQATALVGERARMIADSLLTGIAVREGGLSGARAGRNLPHV